MCCVGHPPINPLLTHALSSYNHLPLPTLIPNFQLSYIGMSGSGGYYSDAGGGGGGGHNGNGDSGGFGDGGGT